MKKVAILDCGGTISMAKEEGLAKAGQSPLDFKELAFHGSSEYDSLLESLGDGYTSDQLIENIVSPGNIDIEVIPRFIDEDSSEAAPERWVKIAKAAAELARKKDGVVVSHGTDTANYTLMGLRWLVKYLEVPLVVTGAQIPARNPDLSINFYSDAFRNIRDSVHVAAYSDIAEPSLVFNGNIFSSENIKKVDAWSLDAFENLWGAGKYGTVNAHAHPHRDGPHLKIIKQDYHKRGPDTDKAKTVAEETVLDANVDIIKIQPWMTVDQFKLRLQNCDGAVLIAYGQGNIPSRFIPAVREVSRQKRIPIVVCTDPKGPPELTGGYDLGSKLLDAGIWQLQQPEAYDDGNVKIVIYNRFRKKSPAYESGEVMWDSGENHVSNVFTGGHFIPEFAATKLNYILSNKEHLLKWENIGPHERLNVAHTLFVSGARFPNEKSRKDYAKRTETPIHDDDMMARYEFQHCAQDACGYIDRRNWPEKWPEELG